MRISDWSSDVCSSDLPIVGHDGVRKLIKSLIDRTHWVDWELKNVFGAGNTVCTERLDCWDFDGKGAGLRLPCVGLFDLNDAGKITGWCDYFDIALWPDTGGPPLALCQPCPPTSEQQPLGKEV